MLVIKRIHVRYRLEADAADEDAARRSHEAHHAYCPVYRTVQACVAITTELEIVAPA